MSHTSSERRGRPDAQFRRALAITVVVLLALCVLFLGLGYVQGPRLASAQVDTDGVVAQSGQQLRMFANQPVAQVSDDQVTVTPAVPFRVTTAGDVIAVQFTERLRYETEYHVRVDGVTSVYLAQPGTVDYRFTTGSPELYFLDRGNPDDAIVRTTLTGAGGDTVYTAPRIQDFAALRNILAVVTLSDGNTSALDLVSVADGVTEQLRLPDVGSISQLGSASSGSILGFTLTTASDGPGQVNARTLYTIDLDAGRDIEPVIGIDGEPLDVLGWQFVPGSASLVALNVDQSLLLVDPVSGSVLPLGQLQEFDRLSSDGAVATGTDQYGSIAVTIADGNQVRMEPSPVDGQLPFLGATEVLPGGDRVSKVVLPNATSTRFASLLVYDDGAASRVLYRTVGDGGSIEDFSVSPNAQYVAIETIPDVSASISDGYFFDARSTSVTTFIVDVDSGAIVKSFEGFSLEW